MSLGFYGIIFLGVGSGELSPSDIPYMNRRIFYDKFKYSGYSKDVTYKTGNEPLPSKWEDYPANSFTIANEQSLQVLQPGELIFEGDDLDVFQDDENYGVDFDLTSAAGLVFEIRSRRIEGTDGTDYIALETDFSNNRFRFKEVIASVETNYDWISHEFTLDAYYKVALWLFEDTAIAIYNGAILGSQSLISITTNKGFSLYVDSFIGDVFFYVSRVFELIAKPAASLEADASNLYVRFRKEMTAEVEDVDSGNWTAFKEAHKLFTLSKDVRYTNYTWWNLGYPVQEPYTEEWLKP